MKQQMKIVSFSVIATVLVLASLLFLNVGRENSPTDSELSFELDPNDSKQGQSAEAQNPTSKREGLAGILVQDPLSFKFKLQQRKALLDLVDPDSVTISDTNQSLVRLRKGFEGISDIEYHRGDSWSAVHSVIAELVPFNGNESLQLSIERHIDGKEVPIYQFQQKVSGIDVEGAILEIKVEEGTGRIVDVYSSLVPDKQLPQPNLGSIEAINIAKHRALEMGIEASNHSEPRLTYVRTPNKDSVDLYWKFSINSKEAYVNAQDGSVSIKAFQLSSVNICNNLQQVVPRGGHPECSEDQIGAILNPKAVFIEGQSM